MATTVSVGAVVAGVRNPLEGRRSRKFRPQKEGRGPHRSSGPAKSAAHDSSARSWRSREAAPQERQPRHAGAHQHQGRHRDERPEERSTAGGGQRAGGSRRGRTSGRTSGGAGGGARRGGNGRRL